MDAKENSARIQAEKDKRLESQVEKVENINPSGQANGLDFERQKSEVIQELEDVLAKLRRMNGIQNEFVKEDDIPKETEDVT